jgi:signal transduction histidine kinase
MLGVVKEEFEERLAFLAVTETDRSLLADLAPLLDRHAERFVSAFYRHLLSFESTRRLLSDPAVKDRLLTKQREYLLSLATPALDERYVEERVRIGEVHERIGLDPRWYLGAYSLYFSLLAPAISESFRGDPERVSQTLAALVKVLMLDSQLALEAYNARRGQELEHLNRELSEVSRSLAREQRVIQHELRETESRARAAENLASVATLVAGLAHEIGTPMGVIRGHAEALESAVEGEKAQWRARTIREQIDRISAIIQSLLNIARPRQAICVPVDLAGVADTAIAFLAEKLGRRGVEVERDYAEKSAAVRGDPDKLQQLFLNLFLNAIDAMPEGGRLRVAIRTIAEREVEIAVSDSGTGIAAADLPHVFTPFFTTKPAGRGSGLGLVVAEGIVADHRGHLEVSSEIGTGTEFRIRLPIDTQLPATLAGA